MRGGGVGRGRCARGRAYCFLIFIDNSNNLNLTGASTQPAHHLQLIRYSPYSII